MSGAAAIGRCDEFSLTMALAADRARFGGSEWLGDPARIDARAGTLLQSRSGRVTDWSFHWRQPSCGGGEIHLAASCITAKEYQRPNCPCHLGRDRKGSRKTSTAEYIRRPGTAESVEL